MSNEAVPGGRQVWPVKKVLDFASDYFEKAKIDSPHLEAELLLSHALKLKRIDLYIKFEKELSNDELAAFKALIIRRKAHEPTAYITGKKAFMSLELEVNKNVLIPRPETEMLIEEIMHIAEISEDPLNILDIGTGSGAIAVSLAKYIPSSTIKATDISQAAIDTAKVNAAKIGVEDRIVFELADLFPKNTDQYDVIVSNPPYIPSSRIDSLAPEVRQYEPIKALDGGDDGLFYYRQIIPGAYKILKESGYLILEIDSDQVDALTSLAKSTGYKEIESKKDLSDLHRVIKLKK